MAAATYMIAEESVRAASKKPRRFYAPELDALRFIAFLLVFGRHVGSAFGFIKKGLEAQHSSAPSAGVALVHHAGLSSYFKPQEMAQSLDFGVCLFFFLSSFLITRLLLIERETTGAIRTGSFYLRRCLRIWPLYFSFLALVLALSHFFPVLHSASSRLLATLFFAGNWAAVLHGWSSIAIQPLWSVSVEEQFYLLWPAFARHGRRAIVAGSCLLVLVSVATLIYFGNKPGTEVTATWPNTFVQGLFLAGGALTACCSFPEKRWIRTRIRLAMLVLGGVCWVVASTVCHIVRTQSPGAVALVAGYALVLAGTMLIFNATAGWSGRPLPKSLLYLGKISFGLYVFHVACLLLMEQMMAAPLVRGWLGPRSPYLVEGIASLLALLLTILCASVTYHFLERPFLKLKDRFTAVHSRPI